MLEALVHRDIQTERRAARQIRKNKMDSFHIRVEQLLQTHTVAPTVLAREMHNQYNRFHQGDAYATKYADFNCEFTLNLLQESRANSTVPNRCFSSQMTEMKKITWATCKRRYSNCTLVSELFCCASYLSSFFNSERYTPEYRDIGILPR